VPGWPVTGCVSNTGQAPPQRELTREPERAGVKGKRRKEVEKPEVVNTTGSEKMVKKRNTTRGKEQTCWCHCRRCPKLNVSHDEARHSKSYMEPSTMSMAQLPNLLGQFEHHSPTTDGSISICILKGFSSAWCALCL
jgi:hypothetical protein